MITPPYPSSLSFRAAEYSGGRISFAGPGLFKAENDTPRRPVHTDPFNFVILCVAVENLVTH